MSPSIEVDASTLLARSTSKGEAEYQALITRLQQVWPNLQPIPGQPELSAMDAWNGIWITGRLAYDTGTRTFRTFRVLRFGGVPLVFLGAYRVYEKDTGGLVFVGRQPLPAWAVAYNLFGIPLVAAVFALFFGSFIEVCR